MLTRTGDPLEFNDIPQSLELLRSIQECDATLNHRLKAFALTDMPTTLREAISVTRYFGVRYIGMDRRPLHAIQAGGKDSTPEHNRAALEDWQKESGLMDQIYENAYLTIVAAGAPHSGGGLIDCAPHC